MRCASSSSIWDTISGKKAGRTVVVTLCTLTGTAINGGALLKIDDLKTYFYTPAGPVKSVNGVSFEVHPGETLAIVGESGSGKSVTSLSIMRLVDAPGKIVSGSILFRTKLGAAVDLARCSEADMRRIRGNDIAMVFQEPMTSLNPAFTAGDQIAEAITLHQGKSRKEAWQLAVEMLALAGIPDPEKRVRAYPHQMSGGMRQRVMIAIALSSKPSLLIADEPTTALDVTIQAQILDLTRKLQTELGMGILLITHNLGVVAEVASRVAVMYAGRVVEQGSVAEVFKSPKHPYTAALLRSIPRPGSGHGSARLEAIPGSMPSPFAMPPGCAFAPRCSFAVPDCSALDPLLVETAHNHSSRCLRWRDM
jgi:peptide/nickel transport system ATP-binding protein